jgi:4a-hydroxytetrahydrobiopterin dehydratase
MARDHTLLAEAELQSFLAAHPGWKLEGKEIRRTYEFPAFLTGITFVQRVAEVAEREDHHPDIDIRWCKVTLALTTHDAGGLTFRDPRIAAEADRLYTEVTRAR